MSVFKKFFEKKKLDSKFKKAGDGHTISTNSSSKLSAPSSSHIKTTPPVTAAVGRTDGVRMAGIAALQRVENQSVPTMVNRSQNVIRAEALKELEAESQRKEVPPDTLKEEARCVSSPTNSVFFTCPLIGAHVLPKDEINIKIREFLYEQLDEEPGLISCLIIKTCNKDKEKIRLCVETLIKCLDNILEHRTEEKFRKLRVSNKAFQEKVVSVEGSLEFLGAAGFEKQMLGGESDDKQEEFYILSDDALNCDHLEALRDALISAEAIRPELDRNVKVLVPAQQLEKVDLPAEFYRLSVDELKREQQYRAEIVEKSQMLRTKAMREREVARERRLYRFCFIRTRFPDGLLLQGTFKTWEKLSDVMNFVKEHLVDVRHMPFTLSTVNGQRLTEGDADLTLAELGLIPAVVIVFSLDSSDLRDDDHDADSRGAGGGYLKPETLSLAGL